jgi:hypothetical protein
MTKRLPRCSNCDLTPKYCKCAPKQKSTRDLFGISMDVSKVKVTPLEKITLTEKMIIEYEECLETISEIQSKLMKFGFHADQLHQIRRQKYASKLKNQRDMWETLAKSMIGGQKVNLRYVKSPYCNVEIPLFKDEEVS